MMDGGGTPGPWTPAISKADGPLYLAIADAIAATSRRAA